MYIDQNLLAIPVSPIPHSVDEQWLGESIIGIEKNYS